MCIRDRDGGFRSPLRSDPVPPPPRCKAVTRHVSVKGSLRSVLAMLRSCGSCAWLWAALDPALTLRRPPRRRVRLVGAGGQSTAICGSGAGAGRRPSHGPADRGLRAGSDPTLPSPEQDLEATGRRALLRTRLSPMRAERRARRSRARGGRAFPRARPPPGGLTNKVAKRPFCVTRHALPGPSGPSNDSAKRPFPLLEGPTGPVRRGRKGT